MGWLSVVFAGLIGVAVMVGHGQPLAENVQRLRLTDCEPPCWIGITPGLTTEGRAQRLFSEIYPQQKVYSIAPNSAGGSLQMQTNSYPPQPSDLVMSMLIADLDSTTGMFVINSALMPRLGDTLMLWGQPTCMYQTTPNMWLLRYNRGLDGLSVVEVMVLGHRFSPDQPIYFLMFYRAPAGFTMRCLRDDAKQWQGFTTLP